MGRGLIARRRVSRRSGPGSRVDQSGAAGL